MSKIFIDVRERDEFSIEHIENSINVPLSHFSTVAPGVLKLIEDREIIFICHSGVRSNQAINMAKGLGYQNEHSYSTYEGGLLQWKKKGEPVVKKQKNAILIINRQVQLTAGALILFFGILGGFVNPAWSFVAAAMGAGLVFAGATGMCMLANILGVLPWNRMQTK